ncbi:hypothetical protein GFY24_01610 [Nocardia sp. SYP-A9097]|uniref:hypothetical protein n=1 Tax=Nocardia sp. SYP-A9097 TaxID=2663237 RepID=UPI00129B1D22|nr:hypothetical protein [Nocardia sp. SYP-A9097]MRH86172.1 hypothetical protein [Nocardia sp. SYP-A9097]
MSNPVPAWTPGSFSAATASKTTRDGSNTYNLNNLPQQDTFRRLERLSASRRMVKSFKTKQT